MSSYTEISQDIQHYWSIANTTHDPLLKLEAIDSVLSKSFRKNNGIGYNFSEKYIDSNSLGLKTLLERTKFLKGQMKVHSNKENGTLIEYTFPIL